MDKPPVAVVTGRSRGIGCAIVEMLASRGIPRRVHVRYRHEFADLE